MENQRLGWRQPSFWRSSESRYPILAPATDRIMSTAIFDGKAKVAKDLVEAIDAENNLITFKVIEGDLLEHYKSFKFTIHATPKGEGCNVHWTLEYEKHHHDDIEDPHTLLQLLVELSKDIDAHLTSTDA
ncbi:MLP-like protein 34 [Malus sylvestris]|uniref:MLP-like protein 34 n=1 Tax=Malus sylvestris TaxID=3752 RepID=UPI0021ABFC83|nr:MLP-like protein 34 [Malus sylvestris]